MVGWDFFVSYTQTDRSWAEWVAWQLEEAGYRVLVQAWDFVPNSSWTHSMHKGVSQSDRTVALLSQAYTRSEYATAEWQAAWAADPLGERGKLMVLRVEDCPRPGLLAQVVGIDLFDRPEDKARQALLRAVRSAQEGRSKPAQAPAFPGATTGATTAGASPRAAAARAVPARVPFPGTGPRVWNAPGRNPNFVGRAADLDAVGDGLADGSSLTVQSLHGLGGIGKTQLATEFAHRHAGDYEVVWWFNAQEPSRLPDQCAALARDLGLDPPPDPDAVRAQVNAALRDCPAWLLVFDNAEHPQDLRGYYPGQPRPADRPGHVLVTTRRTGFTALGQVRTLDVISPTEAVALMRTRVPDLAEDDTLQIAAELGYLPLAVEQAAAYLEQTAMAAQAYLRMLRTRTAQMLGKGHAAGHADTIATLWTVSLEALAQANPAAAQLLDVCAFFAPDPIPLALFTDHPDVLDQPLRQTAADELDFTEAVGALTGYSLASVAAGGLLVHRLVQAAVRARQYGQPLPRPTLDDEQNADRPNDQARPS